jgi:hypothetical protein
MVVNSRIRATADETTTYNSKVLGLLYDVLLVESGVVPVPKLHSEPPHSSLFTHILKYNE